MNLVSADRALVNRKDTAAKPLRIKLAEDIGTISDCLKHMNQLPILILFISFMRLVIAYFEWDTLGAVCIAFRIISSLVGTCMESTKWRSTNSKNEVRAHLALFLMHFEFVGQKFNSKLCGKLCSYFTHACASEQR